MLQECYNTSMDGIIRLTFYNADRPDKAGRLAGSWQAWASRQSSKSYEVYYMYVQLSHFFALFIGDFGPVSFSHSDEKGTP